MRADSPAESPRDSAAIAGTGAPLGAALPSRPAAPPAAGPPAAPAARGSPASPLTELHGVRLLQPARWLDQAEGAAVEVLVANTADQARTLVVVVGLHDWLGQQLATASVHLADLDPGETRTVVQPFPSLATAPAEVRVRLQPVQP